MYAKFKPITNRKIKVGIVGCGRIFKKHLEAITNNFERIELVAICDENNDSLEKANEFIKDVCSKIKNFSNNPKRFFSYKILLDYCSQNPNFIDLIVLATPSGLHPSQVISAAKCGLNVMTEKPMATKWADGLSMVKACDDAGVRLYVIKQNRFNRTLQLLKKQIVNGRFGRIAMVTSNVFWQRPQSYYDQDSWRGTWEFDGGALMNQASHYVDLMEWLVGPIASVNASIATVGRNIEVEDTATLNLRWRNGALGSMSVTMLTYPKNLEGSIIVLGENGSVKVGGEAVNKIEFWEFKDNHPDDKNVEINNYEVKSVYGSGHSLFYSNILDHFQGKNVDVCDGREGLKSLELLIGAYRSARDGKNIYLPLDY
ncbi:Gfo/Idh/MocA family protein [Prochlorococcus marinus]|uniref:Oxidoreductase n=1 Tax=Prochlorococcus marinus (strain AS9601) TaxID=146891 RepID=A2BSD3_PROMS|nr:Gfo/Idh/MocA family oxidoreductase [Prochlorococcus marinus]ABM70694.1 Hypothetical protein A9601_14101 [Prochlorococcus marinus str. AS9601]